MSEMGDGYFCPALTYYVVSPGPTSRKSFRQFFLFFNRTRTQLSSTTLKNEDDLKNEDKHKNEQELENENDHKIEDTLKNEDNPKNEDNLKNADAKSPSIIVLLVLLVFLGQDSRANSYKMHEHLKLCCLYPG